MIMPNHSNNARDANPFQQQLNISRFLRLRRAIVFLLFISFSLITFNQDVDNWKYSEAIRNFRGGDGIMVPLVEREWDRMLYGIFTYDSPNEATLRAANRETHLSYFKHHIIDYYGGNRTDVICSLHDLLNNSTLARDAQSCRIVYTFVMGGGVGNINMTKKAGSLINSGQTDQFNDTKTRCLWEDSECGGKNISEWTLDVPKCNISNVLARELTEHNDITFLSIPENHELGKTDTWFTYMAMLTWQYPELQIGFVGKIDSDNFVRWPVFFRWLSSYAKEFIDAMPFIYGGYAIHKNVCKNRDYGYICAKKEFIGERFVTGAMAYMSTPLAQHVYMHGTTLEQKKAVWILQEDVQLGNMAYSDPKITPFVISHRYGRGGDYINLHSSNDPTLYKKEYYISYPDQEKRVTEMVVSNLMNGTDGAQASKGYIKWAKKQAEQSAAV